MMHYLLLFARAFVLVALTAGNVRQVSQGHYLGAFIVGGILSWVWFGNAHTAAHSQLRFARETYAFGAAVGTICGMYLGR